MLCFSDIIILVTIILLVYLRSTIYVICTSKKRLDGKTALITGGTTGMGLQIATDFAARGARVIIACPFEKEGTDGREYIIKKTGNRDIEFKSLDLSSITSTRQFARELIESEQRLDILINNAGVIFGKEYITQDGISYTMQVNYFGPFLLTLLLLPLLKKTGNPSEVARIVNVTSLAHHLGKIDFVKLNDINHWSSFQIYANSKLFLMIFGRTLSKKLKCFNVVINNADPGMVAGTSIVKSSNKILDALLKAISLIANTFLKTPWEGAQTAIHVALENEAEWNNGEMFFNCKLSRAASTVYDDNLAEKVWVESAKLLKISKEELKV